jgi:competence protein ComEC
VTLIVALLTALLLACTQPAFAQSVRIYFFDVGQGDGVLIQSPSGQNVVYDGGPAVTRMVEHLEAAGVSNVNMVIASHNHADHIGGLPEVIRRYRPRFFLENGVPTTTATYRRLIESVDSVAGELIEPTERRISFGDVTLQVVPPPGIEAWDQNNNSVGIVVEFGDFRLSLAGDAEQPQWSWWLDHYPNLFRPVQVHKASHHGSRNGDGAAGIASLSPKVVIINVGQNNGYGHPDPRALELYTSQRSEVHRTDLHGTIVVEAERSGKYTIRQDHPESTRPQPRTAAPPVTVR